MINSSTEAVFEFRASTAPLLVSIPHSGTAIPKDIATRMTPVARRVPDTDWFVDRLYNFLDDLDANVIRANYSRYVVDLNRPADMKPLYPGQSETGLCPVQTFSEEDIYNPGGAPDTEDIQARISAYWQPYHDKIAVELDRIKSEHGYALLWDAHSIATQVPQFFDGRLPDLNIGTNSGQASAPEIGADLYDIARNSDFSAVINGRFKGGYITRHYGDPKNDVHAVQLEIAQDAYCDEGETCVFNTTKAEKLRPILEQMLRCFRDSQS